LQEQITRIREAPGGAGNTTVYLAASPVNAAGGNSFGDALVSQPASGTGSLASGHAPFV
jgi:hypothetical protein